MATERFNQCNDSIAFICVNDQCPNYLNKVFETTPENNIQTRVSFQKLKCPFCKTNEGQMIFQPHWAKPLRCLRNKKSQHVST